MRSEKSRPPLPAGPFLVVGLARSGQAAARLLAGRGEEVIGVDAGAPDGAERLRELGVEVNLDGDGIELVERARCVVKSPGVPREAPAIAAARERDKTIIGELELAWRLLPNRFIGVTGTNGKTTVAELLGHVWRTSGVPAAVAGNVGTPLASLAGELAEDTDVICECSSFQLEDAEAFAPECGVLLNATPDHLDRHGDFDSYLAAKLRLFANQGNDDVAVFNGSDPALRGIDLGGCARRVAFCREPGTDCELTLSGDAILAGDDPLVTTGELQLLGAHNAENAMAAAAAALAMGLGRDEIAEGVRTFAGVPHRLEIVRERDGVRYVNDSKATNVAAARAAIESFPAGVHAILGGSSKGESFAALAPAVTERCSACYLIGETVSALERDLEPAWEAGVEHAHYGDLAEALSAAAAAAQPGDVVLLAPACASFDAYRDYEERGEHFRSLVEAL
jgi:UDP-N-acetylmuramoylalanine--D-glutamate ligase